MSLDLDPRQRAMLAEMGITVWQPAAEPAPAAAAATAAVPAAVAAGAPAAPPPPAAPRTPDAGAGPALRLHAPQPLYPQADPAATPVALGAGWLVVAESAAPDAPLTGDAGKLLDNMLRAMRLHRHPRTFFAAVERAAPGPAEAAAAADVADALQAAIAALRPSMVLVLGLSAARAVLGSREPLGRLRATAHQLPDGTPAVVTYDPAYLLRAPDAKAAAWSDLCRALARVRSSGAAPAPAAPSGH
ncbi:uracil-DNA glycosylase family protein [Paracidovorax konjaci]|uniref:DNA polymerase n=1 Tax=Paracidovorax konjaci TaxID=32040 RepID=A0A1I1W1E1_9BURK|nr:uracil-DNA glycosylase family protein [Paracidovorax konjaci]SFD88935.1 DNA polymerase [Paracidovorax konjaci]